MPDPDNFARGVLIGLTAAAPVGPMAILCIRHTLTSGLLAGIGFGAGIAAADTTYAAIAAVGVNAITSILNDHESLIRFTGGVFIVVLGLTVLNSARSATPDTPGDKLQPRGMQNVGIAFALTMANPMTILVFAALIAGYGHAFGGSGQSTLQMMAGVFAGSMGWWIALASVFALIRLRITWRWTIRIIVVSGALIVVSGFLAIGAVLR